MRIVFGCFLHRVVFERTIIQISSTKKVKYLFSLTAKYKKYSSNDRPLREHRRHCILVWLSCFFVQLQSHGSICAVPQFVVVLLLRISSVRRFFRPEMMNEAWCDKTFYSIEGLDVLTIQFLYQVVDMVFFSVQRFLTHAHIVYVSTVLEIVVLPLSRLVNFSGYQHVSAGIQIKQTLHIAGETYGSIRDGLMIHIFTDCYLTEITRIIDTQQSIFGYYLKNSRELKKCLSRFIIL